MEWKVTCSRPKRRLDDMEDEEQKSHKVLFPYTREPKTCLIHLKPIEKRVSKNGWEYYKCSDSRCMLFCAAEDVNEYLKCVQTQLCGQYRYRDDLAECFCRRFPVLKVSKSEKNYGRPYMTCNQKEKCNYFQWANSYVRGRNEEWKEQRL